MNLEEVLYIHFRVVKDYGGVQGVANEKRLLSAVNKLNSPGVDYIENASYFLMDIVQDHPFVDGNKRTAVAVAGIYLGRKGYLLTCSPKNLEDFAIEVAINKLKPSQTKSWLKNNTAKSNIA